MNRRKILFLALICFFLLPLLAADSFVFGMGNVPVTFDPFHAYTMTEAQIFTGIYEGLVSYHPYTMEPVPGAASRWELSDDRTVYTFYLRNTTFSNGDPLTAQDFVNTWKRFLDPNEEAKYSFLFDVIKNAEAYRTAAIDDFDAVGIKALNAQTLELTLNKAAGHFLKILCHHAFVPVHPDFLSLESWPEDRLPIGNGAFVLVEDNEEGLLLQKNEHYWDAGNVALDSIVIRRLDDTEEATKDFNEGNIHWLVDMFNYPLLENPFSLVISPMFHSAYFFFNCSYGIYENPLLRQALAGVLPWQNIRNRTHMYSPSARLIPPIPGYPEVPVPESISVEEAYALLEQAGYNSDTELPEITIMVPGGDFSRIAEIMKSTWEEAFPVSVKIRNAGRSFLQELGEGNYTLSVTSWIGDFADPLAFLQMWTSDSNLNDARYSNPEFDRLIFEGMAERGAARYELYSLAEALLLAEAVVLPMRHDPSLNVIDTMKIGGWYVNPLDIHPFKYLSIDELFLPPNVAQD